MSLAKSLAVLISGTLRRYNSDLLLEDNSLIICVPTCPKASVWIDDLSVLPVYKSEGIDTDRLYLFDFIFLFVVPTLVLEDY